MKKVLFVLAFLVLAWSLKAECPPEVEDFTFTDCYGVEYNLFELLDNGQHVFVEFLPVGYPDATRIKEVYHRFGCNGREMFVMSLCVWKDDEAGISWLTNNGVECPLVTTDGGAQQFFDLYEDCMEIPRYLLIYSNHEICRESITYMNMYNVFDSLGIMPADCNFGECEAPTKLRAELLDADLLLSWAGVENAQYYHVYNRSYDSTLDTIDYFEQNVYDTVCLIDFNPRLGGNYYVVSHCEDGSECASEIVSVPPTAFNFTATDCHGNEIHLFDILDRGQYVLVEAFYYSCPGCHAIAPNVVDSYYRYGCNEEDIFYIEVTEIDGTGTCLQWCEEYGVEFPTISMYGGGTEIYDLYHLVGAPDYFLIAPDHSIIFAHTNYPFEYHFSFNDMQSVIDAYEAIGIEEHPCYNVVEEANEQKINLFPNPADGCVCLSVEVSNLIKVYDTQGQLMDSFIAENQQVKIETGNYHEGLYFVQVDGRGIGKFVVRH